MNDVQMGMSVAISREALDFQASMAASVINGSLASSQEMQETLVRAQGMALEGIGSKINIEV